MWNWLKKKKDDPEVKSNPKLSDSTNQYFFKNKTDSQNSKMYKYSGENTNLTNTFSKGKYFEEDIEEESADCDSRDDQILEDLDSVRDPLKKKTKKHKEGALRFFISSILPGILIEMESVLVHHICLYNRTMNGIFMRCV